MTDKRIARSIIHHLRHFRKQASARLSGVYNPLNRLVGRIKRMKGKILIFLFGVAFVAFAQLLTFYFNPANWPLLASVLKNPVGVLYNLIWAFAPLLTLLLLWRLIRVEDRQGRATQDAKDQKQIEAIKQAIGGALKRDREEQRQNESEKTRPSDWHSSAL